MARRNIVVIVAMALIVGSCTTAEPAGTSVTTTSSTSSTTTSTLPATTTTLMPLSIEGASGEPQLEALVHDLYSEPMPARPVSAVVSIGQYDESSRVAVVEADEDVTLMVADPAWRIVGGWWPSRDIGPMLGDFPKLVAVVGSDARPGQDPLGTQADSIHFIGLDGQGNASVLGLPRDSWVPVEDVGNMKLTSVLLRHGPDKLFETFGGFTELPLDGYVLTGFEGFRGLIDVLGGLDIDVPFDFNDRWADAYIDAGQQVLSAYDALAFARTRKTISGGDFTRQEHGGLALIAAARMIDTMGISAVPGLMEMSQELYHTSLSAEEMLLLVAAILESDLDTVVNVVAPGTVGSTSGGASIVRLHEEAYDLFADMADGRLDR